MTGVPLIERRSVTTFRIRVFAFVEHK
jgi:hypothetical protein